MKTGMGTGYNVPEPPPVMTAILPEASNGIVIVIVLAVLIVCLVVY